jgi:hypothetical protein
MQSDARPALTNTISVMDRCHAPDMASLLDKGRQVKGALLVLAVISLLSLPGCKKPNYAPETAVVPRGEPFVFVNSPTAMSSNVKDIDGDSVAIRFAWGEGDTSDWSPYFPERGWTSMTHTWTSAGSYTVTAQARDQRGALSDWSGGYAVHVIRGWAKTFGGVGYNVANSVQQTRDGGYIITGFTDLQGTRNGNAWLIKTDAKGDTVWTRTFGGTGTTSVGNSVRQTTDGGYVIAGSSRPHGANGCDVLLMRTDADGDTIWTRTFGRLTEEGGTSVQQTQDGGYVFVATTSSPETSSDDVWLLKTDANGDTIWTRTYGETGLNQGSCVQQTQDGGYVVVGNTNSLGAGHNDVWLLKTDANGDTVWTRTYGGSGSDHGESVQQTLDGEYIVTGSTTSGNMVEWGVLLVKIDSSGGAVWTRTYVGYDAEGRSVQQTLDGGYVITGTDGHALLIKTDANGDTLWTRTFGWASTDEGNSVQQTQDGGYIIAGITSTGGPEVEDARLIRIESDGQVSGALASGGEGTEPDANARP